MTKRAILWCGYGRRAKENLDFEISANDLYLSIRAALAAGVKREDIYPFVCDEDLLPSDFRGACRPPTLTSLDACLQEIRRGAAPEDALIFIATNHGDKDGLYTSAVFDELSLDAPSVLNPSLLDT
jgi:hypothetical protein